MAFKLSLYSGSPPVMKCKVIAAIVLSLGLVGNVAQAQKLTADIPYVADAHKLQVLDIYTPEKAATGSLPVMFLIDGGGWETGDETQVGIKPMVMMERGYMFVLTIY